ncbi:MAG TPA: IS481 family transposase [Gemmataceae bacterium]|nr:IS481 family transposase [Gemmataceae bacterium]
MPWSTTTVSELRTAFVHAVRTANRPVVQAARDFGISRPTAYKWLARYDAREPLADRSRKPAHSPTRTAEGLEAAVLAVRDRYGWGPRKIVAYLKNQNRPTPPVRTAAAILRRHHRVAPTPTPGPTDCQRFERPEPNQLWQLDFKGFVEIDRRRIYPLTILDDHSRFLLALACGTDQTYATAWAVLWAAFGEYGLPEQLLCDNAFGTHGRPAPGLSWFEARLLRLGVRPIHGRPYHPQTQGKIERLHGTLEAEVFPRLPHDRLDAFQAGLDHWRQCVYNAIRPHEALGDAPPLTRWRPSPRSRPATLPAVEYPSGVVLRKVAATGDIRWHSARILAGQGLVGEYVRVEEADGCVTLWYGTHRIRQVPLDRLRDKGLL